VDVPNLIEGYFPSVASEKPGLFYANRLVRYRVRVSVLVKVVEHKENQAESQPKRDEQRDKNEQGAQEDGDSHKDYGKLDKGLFHERPAAPKNRHYRASAKISSSSTI